MKRRSSKERGYVMVLFALALGVFLTLGGIAVDLAHLYTWQARIERAAKAAAFSTIQYRAIQGWGDFFTFNDSNGSCSSSNTLLLQHATSVLRQNLATFHPAAASSTDANLTFPQPNSTFYDCRRDQVTIDASYRVPTFVLGRVARLIGSNFTDNTFRASVRSTATAQLDPVAVALVLDVSGSMNCTDPTCACRTDGSNCQTGTPLIRALENALSGFKGYFNPLHDYISVTTFNLGARTVFPFNNSPFGSSATRYATFNRVTSTGGSADSLRPLSNTNICEGLQYAISELSSLPVPNPASRTTGAQFDRMKKIVVLFTDGAPNAFRGIFSNRTPANSSGDYQYTLEWRNADGTMYRGPSPLVTSSSLFNHVIALNKISPNDTTNLCGPVLSTAAQFPHALNASATSAPIPTPRGCLTRLDFTIPGTSGGASVRNVPIDSNGSTPENFNYAKLAYYCAIEASDYIRSRFDATVFTVGVGFNRTASTCNDPFENIDDPVVRKDRFLHRIAMDPDVLSSSNALDPNFDFSRSGNASPAPTVSADCGCRTNCPTTVSSNCYSCTQSIGYSPGVGPDFDESLQGEYFGTSSGDQLGALFSMVAKQILLRLGS